MRCRWIIPAGLMLAGFAWPTYGQNCCLPKLGDDAAASRLIGGIQMATLVLLVVPFVLVSASTLWLTRSWRDRPGSASAEDASEAPNTTPESSTAPPR